MGLSDNRIKWDRVAKCVARDTMKTNWRPWGMPEIVDARGSAFADVDTMPRWSVPEKVGISTTINGAFFSRNANPNVPVSPAEIRASAEECIEAGAQIVHVHVRDENGYNVLDVDRFREVIEPLRERYPHVAFDACLVAVNEDESAAMERMMRSGMLDSLPVNTTAILLADNMFFKSPHAIIQKTRLALEAGLRPQMAVYTDADIDNARRFLVDSGLVDPPHFWLILPALPGCSPMYSPDSMITGLVHQVRLIREISPDPVISVCAAGRASTYLATLALLMGLHVRVGMEDSVYLWPHRDDLIESNATHFRMVRDIARGLGRDVMSAQDYLQLIGAAGARIRASDPRTAADGEGG